VIVPLRSKRRERVVIVQKLQHAAPVLILLPAGLRAVGEGARGFALALAIFEIVSSVLLIGSFFAAIRKARRPVDHGHLPHPHHGPDWIDVATAAVLFAEAAERYHLTHHVARPTILLGLVLLTIGLLHGRIVRRAEKRFTLRVEDGGLFVGGKPFRAIRAPWDEVAAIEVGARFATIKLRGGRERKLDLADLEGAQHVRHALTDAQSRAAAARTDERAPR
jgi:hypothetical protein